MADRSLHRRAVLGGITVAGSAPAAARADNYVTPVGMLDGTWEGNLDPVSGAGLSPTRLRGVRLVISGQNVSVFTPNEGALIEIKPGTFVLQRDGTNAVITSIQIDPGRPRNEGWVETWCFAVTLNDSATLIANFVRVVNNNDLAADRDGARFSQIASGLLQRVSDDV